MASHLTLFWHRRGDKAVSRSKSKKTSSNRVWQPVEALIIRRSYDLSKCYHFGSSVKVITGLKMKSVGWVGELEWHTYLMLCHSYTPQTVTLKSWRRFESILSSLAALCWSDSSVPLITSMFLCCQNKSFPSFHDTDPLMNSFEPISPQSSLFKCHCNLGIKRWRQMTAGREQPVTAEVKQKGFNATPVVTFIFC